MPQAAPNTMLHTHANQLQAVQLRLRLNQEFAPACRLIQVSNGFRCPCSIHKSSLASHTDCSIDVNVKPPSAGPSTAAQAG